MGKTRLRVGRAGDEGEGKKRLGRWGKERSEAERRDRRGEAAMLAPRGDSEGRKKYPQALDKLSPIQCIMSFIFSHVWFLVFYSTLK